MGKLENPAKLKGDPLNQWVVSVHLLKDLPPSAPHFQSSASKSPDGKCVPAASKSEIAWNRWKELVRTTVLVVEHGELGAV